MLVGSGAGGTTDISGRVIAEHLQRHIPGHPTIIVQNMPGGGSVTMTNHLFRSAPRNGAVLGYSLPGIITAQLMEPERAPLRRPCAELDRLGAEVHGHRFGS